MHRTFNCLLHFFAARQSDDQEAANLTAVGAGAGAGAVLLLGAGFVAIVLIVRKR